MIGNYVRLIRGVMGLFIASVASAGIGVVVSPSALNGNGTVD